MHNKELGPAFLEESLRAKEYFLSLALDLDEAQFLDIASLTYFRKAFLTCIHAFSNF